MPPLEKLRGAYRWILDHAIVTNILDMNAGLPELVSAGPHKSAVSLGAGFSSFVLMPLLTLATNQRLLILGGPGRGKTSIAMLVGMLAGPSLEEVRRAVQRGHPQLAVPDLLGSPLPAQLIRAEDASGIKVVWRKWITMRVKIVDEYNRIPTKTQSALLSLLAEGYAEQFEQTVSAGPSCWFLTANDDQGGGTYPVIEALKDRIDAVARAAAYDSRGLEILLDRVASGESADFVPEDLTFKPGELDALAESVRAVAVPSSILDFLSFFGAQLEFCRLASDRLETMTKDTLHLAGRKVGDVCTEDCPLDKRRHACSQTESGISARSIQALLLYAKAFAAFLGQREVTMAHILSVAPWVLHEKLVPNESSPYFETPRTQKQLVDRLAWIRELFDLCADQYARHKKLGDWVQSKSADVDQLSRMSKAELEETLSDLKKAIQRLLSSEELGAAVRDDVLRLRATHARSQERLVRLSERRSR